MLSANKRLAELRMAAHRQRVANINRDSSRTEAWKKGALASEYRAARVDIEGYRRAEDSAREARAAALQKKLFGDLGRVTGQDALSMRDAFNAAREIKSADDAAVLLNQAELTGDSVLGRAVLAICIEGGANSADERIRNSVDGGKASGWSALIQQYGQAHPLDAPAIAELAELNAPVNSKDAFADHAAFTVPVPDALRGPGSISDLADAHERTERGEHAPAPVQRGGGLYLPTESRGAGIPIR